MASAVAFAELATAGLSALSAEPSEENGSEWSRQGTLISLNGHITICLKKR